MAKSRGWRSYAYNCIFVVYMKKKSGKIIFIREKSGNYQGISFLDFCGHPVLQCLLLTTSISIIKANAQTTVTT